MTYQQFKDKYYQEILPNKHEDIRKGQALMNFLGDIWFAEYKRMSSKFAPNVDCFYNDNLIPAALCHLQNNWHKFYEDIKKVYYVNHNLFDIDDYSTVVCYYINNNEIVFLFNLSVNAMDSTDVKVKQELISLGFSENICLVKS